MKENGVIIFDDARAVNFREIRMGDIAPGTLYRSSHPVKDDRQEPAVSALASRARIAAVLNLCDFDAEIKRKAVFAPWYDRLLKNGRVCALGMDFGNTSANFKTKLQKGLRFVTVTEGPWLIHCHAGVDRTGFVCVVLESLMGATLDEITNDYLRSFDSNYGSSIYGEADKGDSFAVLRLLADMGGYLPVNDQNLRAVAEHYLLADLKLSAGEIGLLKLKLARKPGLLL